MDPVRSGALSQCQIRLRRESCSDAVRKIRANTGTSSRDVQLLVSGNRSLPDPRHARETARPVRVAPVPPNRTRVAEPGTAAADFGPTRVEPIEGDPEGDDKPGRLCLPDRVRARDGTE